MTSYEKFQEIKKSEPDQTKWHPLLNEWKVEQTEVHRERWKTKEVIDRTSETYTMTENWPDIVLDSGIPWKFKDGDKKIITYEEYGSENNSIRLFMDYERFLIIETEKKVIIAYVYELHGCAVRDKDVILFGHENIVIVDTEDKKELFSIATR